VRGAVVAGRRVRRRGPDTARPDTAGPSQRAHLTKLLVDPAVLKIFHFARFDLGILQKGLGVMPARSIAPRSPRACPHLHRQHGLQGPRARGLGVDLSKQQQSSDWGAAALSDAQVAYAASDVLHLHALKERLDAMLAREGRSELAAACFGFLPHRVRSISRAGRPRYFRPFIGAWRSRLHNEIIT